jgi:hypothetical protein
MSAVSALRKERAMCGFSDVVANPEGFCKCCNACRLALNIRGAGSWRTTF